MIQELLDESTFRNILPDRQQELIKAHCQGIVGLIKAAQSPHQALTIVKKACDAFEKECASPMVRKALEEYLARKQQEVWASKD